MKRRSLRGIVTTGVMATGLLASSNAMAAVDMFLKVDGIQGESTDKVHKGEIDVLAWSWGESAGTARTKKGTVPVACIQDLSLTKYIDASTPALIMNTMVGQVVPTAVLVIRKSGEFPLEYVRLTMNNVTVAAYSTGGSGGEDRLTENVTLHFDSMQGQYVKQRPDGSAGTATTFEIGGNSIGCQ
jgi:type VI secretion system secreted protein Hcp